MLPSPGLNLNSTKAESREVYGLTMALLFSISCNPSNANIAFKPGFNYCWGKDSFGWVWRSYKNEMLDNIPPCDGNCEDDCQCRNCTCCSLCQEKCDCHTWLERDSKKNTGARRWQIQVSLYYTSLHIFDNANWYKMILDNVLKLPVIKPYKFNPISSWVGTKCLPQQQENTFLSQIWMELGCWHFLTFNV